MMDFEAKVAAGVRAFTHYNRRKKRLMELSDPLGSRVILDLFPLCVHINHPALPGYTGDDDCPCGVKCMEWPANTINSLSTFSPIRLRPGEVRNLVPRNREIEGLFTIGSVGSLGQTRESDYDVWVVVDSEAIGKPRLTLLERKLKTLKRWISSQYIIDLHFFLMDINDIRRNNFGTVSQEGAGSALKSILKEEFYRTLTLIEGRVPIWWVTPVDHGDDAYEQTIACLARSLQFDYMDFIDMGNITSIPEQELLGAALWQMHKALDDPLKSVLKMALAATYLDRSGEDVLLCEELKRHVMQDSQDEIIDPYMEIFQCVENYYRNRGDEKTIDLLRKCFYLKVSPLITTRDLLRVNQQDRTVMMVEVVKKWDWPMGFIREMNRFNEWSVEKYRTFGDELHDYLKRTAVLLIRRAKSFLLDSQLDQDVEMEVLRRRVEAFYVAKENKIESEKRVKRREPAYEEIYFAHKNRKWHIYGSYPGKKRENPIMSAERVVRILAWLVYNKRVDASTSFHMVPNTTGVALSDIQALLKELDAQIPDANSIGLDRQALMDKKFVKKVVLVGNMEKPNAFDGIHEVDVLHINSWNEFFCIHMAPGSIREWMREIRTPWTKISVWLPKHSKSRRLVNAMNSLFS
ncbi:MAG: class I adenylate cyclase [Desulfomonilia bacterium]|jgi:adenylate cyclase class 1|uniref:Adenylate cyclase n=1 Tax=anaerobic digester metagenome TaxID=1263854 RepID=A0A485M4N2_9ZZZZ|nr:class I adenylate cyclase [Pseudomonadota bacterium]HON38217.1 class I adenylate cyclase [Deltaproteobacteria bacterium]HRS56067.1 class I adenylate cyclase [Desulfomonilia bacterium]HPD21551.1 class I adenylate cyclase [Deltaproteobacteria bacterium]HPX19775.1 class I adenylate cyclase [Deltaproteobacteria bacterium]